MKYFVLILALIFSRLVYAGPCTAEIENTASELSLEQIIVLVEKEGESYKTFAQVLRSIGTIVDLRRDNQFYVSNSQFQRITAYFNGGFLEGDFIGIYFSGSSELTSPFGLFIGFDISSCQLRSISYDLPF